MSKHVLIIGAGIAGCSAAYQLSGLEGIQIDISDPLPCGSLTSSASTECFRNWWTEPVMLAFIGHSIELYEALNKEGQFGMTRPGYVFFSSQADAPARYKKESELCEKYGAGRSRLHNTSDLSTYIPNSATEKQVPVDGVDVLLADGPSLNQPNWPNLKPELLCAKHIRNCGWIFVQRYLDYINSVSKQRGVSFLNHSVNFVNLSSSDSNYVLVKFDNADVKKYDQVVFAVGPKLREWLQQPQPTSMGPDGNTISNLTFLGRSLPNFNLILEVHAKVVFRDTLKIVPRDAPLMLFDDSVSLDWTSKQRKYIESRSELRHLLEPFRGGVHFRPLGDGDELVAIWTYNLDVVSYDLEKVPELAHIDEYYGEIVVRGLSHFVPELAAYCGESENPLSSANPNIVCVKTGYYCKTLENRPLIGPAWRDDPRVLLLGALSGFGIMSAPASGELIASYCINHLNGTIIRPLPSFAHEFLPSRYTNDDYLEKLAMLARNTGQL